MTKFFFMAVMTANLQGRSLARFNTISSIPQRNIMAADLGRIQDGGAQMCQAQGLEFDDILIENIFFLAECTEEQFTAGTVLNAEFRAQQMADVANAAGAQAQPVDPSEPSSDVHLEPANPVLEPKLEVAVDNTKIGTANDLSELDAQTVEATPVDDVTTSDVVGEEQPFADGDDKPAA